MSRWISRTDLDEVVSNLRFEMGVGRSVLETEPSVDLHDSDTLGYEGNWNT
jgi:hypothetical protein